jgi:hypothetical protein
MNDLLREFSQSQGIPLAKGPERCLEVDASPDCVSMKNDPDLRVLGLRAKRIKLHH